MQLSKITNSSNPEQTVEALVHNTIALNDVVEAHTGRLDGIDEQVEQLFGQTEEIGNELQDANVNIAANTTKIEALEGQFSASSPWKLASNPTINTTSSQLQVIFDSSIEQAVTEYFTSLISLDTPVDNDIYLNAGNFKLTTDKAVSGGGFITSYPFFIPAGTQHFILHGKIDGGIFINETIVPGGTTVAEFKQGKSYIVTTPARNKSGLDGNSDFINNINSEYRYLPRFIPFGLISGKTITGDATVAPTFYKTKG